MSSLQVTDAISGAATARSTMGVKYWMRLWSVIVSCIYCLWRDCLVSGVAVERYRRRNLPGWFVSDLGKKAPIGPC